MTGLRVRLDLLAFVLIFAHLICADTYALPPMTKLLDKCIDGPLGMQVCVQVNKTGCLSMNVDISLNGESLLSGERSISQLVQDIKINNSAPLPFTYCQAISLPLGDCDACLEIKQYRMSSQSRTIDLSGVGSVSCPGDVRQTFQIDGLQLEDCFWVCPNDCHNGACSIDGKCQCPQGYYGPDCSIREENNVYNSTIFPNGDLTLRYTYDKCKLRATATSSAGPVYEHSYVIANITHPVNRNKHYPIFHSNNAAFSPGCRATIYAYQFVIDAQYDKINPSLKQCRAVDYACQGQKELLHMGTYAVDQCETVVVLNSSLCQADTPQQPVAQPISQPPPTPVSSPRPAPRPNVVPTVQEPTAAIEGESNVGKNVVIALAVLVGAGILIVAGYVLYKRWKQRQQIEMIGEYVTEDIFDSDEDEELVTLEPQPGFRV